MVKTFRLRRLLASASGVSALATAIVLGGSSAPASAVDVGTIKFCVKGTYEAGIQVINQANGTYRLAAADPGRCTSITYAPSSSAPLHALMRISGYTADNVVAVARNVQLDKLRTNGFYAEIGGTLSSPTYSSHWS